METSIEFIDLSGVEEQERLWILNFLQSWNVNVKVPWKRPNHCIKTAAAAEDDATSLHAKIFHTNSMVLEKNVYDVNNLNPLPQQHIYHPYTVIPYHNQPVYQNVVYRGLADGPMNVVNNYPQHIQHVIPGSISSNDSNKISTNAAESVNVHHIDEQMPEKPAFENSNKTQTMVHDLRFNESNHLQENGECVISTIEQQKKIKETTMQKLVSKPWTSLFNQTTIQDSNHYEKYIETTSDSIKTEADSNPQLVQMEYSMKDNYNDQIDKVNEFHARHHTDQEAITSQSGDFVNKLNGECLPTTNTFTQENKTWASLFNRKPIQGRHNNNNEQNGKLNETINDLCLKSETEHDTKLPQLGDNIKSTYDDPTYYRLGEFLTAHEIDHRTISLQPRGLINKSNYCYINSILQALLACPPVYNLLSGLSAIISKNTKRKPTPVIYNMSKFVKEFQHLPAAHRISRRADKNSKQDQNSSINCDTPFEPTYIYKMLNGMRNDTFVVEGRQEDAEEFLGCLLNGLNDEMLELMKLINKQTPKLTNEANNFDNDLDKEWQEVMGKNKGCVTRRHELVQTPISDIFNGHLRSRVHRTGDKSSDNVQPFFTLQLNIEKASSVKEALETLVCKNQLEGVTSSKTNEEVEAWQQVTIEDLPYVLILHLKCFDYKLDGCTKIIKALEFPIDLKIDSKLLSSKKDYSPKAKQYKLFAIVYHDGKEASKGHYLTDAYHVGYARWLRYDDATVKAVPEEQVLKPHGTRVPYLLFYRRCDSIRSK